MTEADDGARVFTVHPTGEPPLPTVLQPQSPRQNVDPVLPKKGLAPMDHRRNAPMARRAKGLVIGRERVVVANRIGAHAILQHVQVQAGARRCPREMISLVPGIGLAIPEES